MTRTIRGLAGLALIALLGCSSSGPKTPADQSLTAAEYAARGVPPTERPWSLDDLKAACAALQNLARTNPAQLPRHQSPRSGALFARLTSTEVLAEVRNKALPFDQRFPRCLAFHNATTPLVKTYVDAQMAGAVAGTDVVEMTGLMLRGLVVLCALTNELVPTLDKNDPTYPNRLAGIAQMKRGMNTTLSGFTAMLTETQHYSAADRVRLLGFVKETLPTLLPVMSAADRNNFVGTLQRLSNDGRYADLQPALGELESQARELARSAPPD